MKCCEIDQTFYRTVPFYLKLTELLLCIPVWICVASVKDFPQYGGGGFINFCTTISFFASFILFCLYLFGKIQNLHGPWILIEVIIILGSVVLYLISVIIAAACWIWGSAIIAAAVFCGVQMIIYAIEFGLRFKVMRVEGFRFSTHMKSNDMAGTSNTAANDSYNNPTQGPFVIGA